MEQLNNYPLLLLRQHNRSHKTKQHRLNKRARNKKALRREIYSNHNVFQSDVNLYRNMAAQNILWDKKYDYQRGINQLKDSNSSLKARIWNVEKENRRMERQIEAWGLNETGQARPYVDTVTMQKVLSDQDYSIVSLKIQIMELERQLEGREKEYESILERNRQSHKINVVMDHEIVKMKVEACSRIGAGTIRISSTTEDIATHLTDSQTHISLINKNMEIQRKTKNSIAAQLVAIANQCQALKSPSNSQLQELWADIREMQAQKDGGIELQRRKYDQASKKAQTEECAMQRRMGDFIQVKLSLESQIEGLRHELMNKKGGDC